MKEEWDLYTKERIKTGLLHIRGNEVPKGYFHIVVEIWTIIDNKTILLTKRHPDKPFGLLWECTGGSIISNENSLEGAIREVKEEIGLKIKEDNLEKIMEYFGDDSIYDVYVNYQSNSCLNKIELQKEEVIDKTCVTYEEFNAIIESNKIVPKLAYFKDLIKEKKIRLTTAST